jgi:hypothetical protein
VSRWAQPVPEAEGAAAAQPGRIRGPILGNIKKGAARFGRKGSQSSKSRGFLQEGMVAQEVESRCEHIGCAHMVFVLPAEFHAPGGEEVPVAQLDLGPRPVIFEKPREKNYRHLKALYLKGYINGQPVSRMLVDIGAAVNIMPYSVLRKLGHSVGDLIKTNITLGDFNGQTSEAQGVLQRGSDGGR